MTIVALLTVHRAQLAAFHAYEHAAQAIMRRHGGAIERVIELAEPSEHHRELHVVAFATAAGWEAYRTDPELALLADDRAAAVVSTELWIGRDVAPPRGI